MSLFLTRIGQILQISYISKFRNFLQIAFNLTKIKYALKIFLFGRFQQ